MAEHAPARAPGSGSAWTLEPEADQLPIPLAFPAGVAAVAALVFGHGLGTLPLWRDEAASVAVAARPVSGILAAAGRIDVVHTAYYLLLHPLLGLGDGEALLRLPSLIGAVAAVVLTAELARRLLGLAPALVAVGLLVGNPWLAFYAREARPYALATALVCAAAFALLGGPLTPRRAMASTGLGVLASWMHLFDLLPVLGLLTSQAVLTRRRARGLRDVPVRPATWVACGAVLAAATSPVALIAVAQARQVAWVREPTLADVGVLLRDAPGSVGAEIAVAVLLGVAAVATGVTALARQAADRRTTGARAPTPRPAECVGSETAQGGRGSGGDRVGGRGRPMDGVGGDGVAAPARRAGARAAPAGVLATALVAAMAGPVLLLAVSLAGRPLYVERYVLPTAPLLALAAAAAVALVPGGARLRVVAAGLLVAVALTGVPAAFAGPSDKTEDLRAAAAHLAAAARPGDCVAYDPSWARIGLGHYLSHVPVRLRDVALDLGPAGQDPVGLFPAELPLADVEADLGACDRVWVAGYPGPVGRWRPVPEVTGAALASVADRFTAAAPADFGDFRLVLWVPR